MNFFPVTKSLVEVKACRDTPDVERIRSDLAALFPLVTAKDASSKTKNIQFTHIQPNLAPLEDICHKGKRE